MEHRRYLQKDAILQACRENLRQFTRDTFSRYLLTLDEQLFRLAERAVNNEAQQRYLETMELMRKQYDALEDAFNGSVERAFGDFLRQAPLSIRRRDDTEAPATLALVDNDDLEENIAISTMSRKAEVACSEQLYALNQRLAVLTPQGQLAEEDNPVAPPVFTESIRQAIQPLSLETRAKLVVLKVFDNVFVKALPGLYDTLNQQMIDSGLLPNLRYGIAKAPEPERSGQPPVAYAATEVPPVAATPEAQSEFNQAQLIAAIQQIMSLRRQQLPGTGATYAVWSPRDLVSGLDALQNQDARALEQPVITLVPVLQQPQLEQTLREQHPEGSHLQVSELDSDTIEIVGLLFDQVLNTEQLPDTVKALLSHLHTPFLKVALLDKKFFQHPQHPARQLLNALIEAGERWIAPDSSVKNDVFPQMKAIVQRVITEFNNDLRLFTELALEFGHYLRQLEHRARLAEQRATQAAQGQERLRHIRTQVDALLAEKTGATALPAQARHLLHDAWANYLSFTLLRFGQESDAWINAVKVVDDILWFIQPKLNDSDRQLSQELLGHLERQLSEGLQTVGYDAEKSQQAIASLKMCQKIATSEAGSALANAPEPAPAPAAPEAAQPLQLSEEDQRILERLTQLEFGTWFEFLDADKPPRRVKLAWSNANTRHFMFVNQVGQQVAIRNGAELARDIREGRARIITLEDRPFFEKALEKILAHLRGRQRS